MNKFIDTCRLLGNYNDKEVYLHTNGAKNEAPRIFGAKNEAPRILVQK